MFICIFCYITSAVFLEMIPYMTNFFQKYTQPIRNQKLLMKQKCTKDIFAE